MAKVLYLDHAPIVGGAEVVLLNLIRALDHRQWTPLVAIAADSPFAPALAAAQIEMVAVPFSRLNQTGSAMPFNLLGAVWSVAHLLRRRQVTLVHTNTVRAHIVGSLAGLLTRTPVIWTLHDNTFPRALARMLAPIPRCVITVSRWLREWYRPFGLAHKIIVIHNGLPLDVPPAPAAGLREELRIPPGVRLVINVGRLVAGKAPHLFVEAAQRVAASVPEARFVLVGGPDQPEPGQRPSPYADQLAEAVRASHLGERLILAGHHADVARFYAAADLLVYCSVLPEGWPTVLLEAMRCATPIVASAIGGASEIVVDGQTGQWVPPGDAEALAGAMLALLRDADRARKLGRAGLARLEREFDVCTQAARVTQVYEAALGIT